MRHGQGYTVFEHTPRGARPRAHGLRRREDAGEDLAPPAQERRRARERALGLRVRGVGARRRRATASRAHRGDGVDAATGAVLALEPLPPSFPDACAFFAATSAARERHRRPRGVLRPHGSRAAPARARAGRALRPRRRRPRPVRRDPGRRDARARARRGTSSSCSARRDARSSARDARRAYREPGARRRVVPRRAAAWDDVPRRRAGRDARPGARPARQPLAALPGAELPHLGRASAFYQSGGAYGFRDQLQDVLALLHARPDARARADPPGRGRQFAEGDVQHWWHRRDRRRRAHALLRRHALAALRRRRSTSRRPATTPILDERVPFLEGRALAPGEHEVVRRAARSRRARARSTSTARAPSTRATTSGAHGLPLMGAGDWNDGMNRVGAERARRERLARRGSSRRRCATSPRSPPRAATPPAPTRCLREAARLAARSRGARLGRRLVPARATSTTARRSARARTTSARSTRSPSRGR